MVSEQGIENRTPSNQKLGLSPSELRRARDTIPFRPSGNPHHLRGARDTILFRPSGNPHHCGEQLLHCGEQPLQCGEQVDFMVCLHETSLLRGRARKRTPLDQNQVFRCVLWNGRGKTTGHHSHTAAALITRRSGHCGTVTRYGDPSCIATARMIWTPPEQVIHRNSVNRTGGGATANPTRTITPSRHKTKPRFETYTQPPKRVLEDSDPGIDNY